MAEATEALADAAIRRRVLRILEEERAIARQKSCSDWFCSGTKTACDYCIWPITLLITWACVALLIWFQTVPAIHNALGLHPK